MSEGAGYVSQQAVEEPKSNPTVPLGIVAGCETFRLVTTLASPVTVHVKSVTSVPLLLFTKKVTVLTLTQSINAVGVGSGVLEGVGEGIGEAGGVLDGVGEGIGEAAGEAGGVLEGVGEGIGDKCR